MNDGIAFKISNFADDTKFLYHINLDKSVQKQRDDL